MQVYIFKMQVKKLYKHPLFNKSNVLKYTDIQLKYLKKY